MTRDDWERLLDEDPGNSVTRLAYADWLEDNSFVTMARAQRWMGDFKRWPFFVSSSKTGLWPNSPEWRWYGPGFKPQGTYTAVDLDVMRIVMRRLTKDNPWLSWWSQDGYLSYPSRLEAELALALVLET